jgi:hypothetical protein
MQLFADPTVAGIAASLAERAPVAARPRLVRRS